MGLAEFSYICTTSNTYQCRKAETCCPMVKCQGSMKSNFPSNYATIQILQVGKVSYPAPNDLGFLQTTNLDFMF